LQLLLYRFTIALRAPWHRFASVLSLLLYRFALNSPSLCNSFAIALQSLCYRFAIALRSLYDWFAIAIALPSPCHPLATPLQLLLYRFVITIKVGLFSYLKYFAIAPQSLEEEFTTPYQPLLFITQQSHHPTIHNHPRLSKHHQPLHFDREMNASGYPATHHSWELTYSNTSAIRVLLEQTASKGLSQSTSQHLSTNSLSSQRACRILKQLLCH
jgi:hypothetical protein